MAYNWTQLGINEIINLYLYGQITTPSDLTSESLIRPPTPISIAVDVSSYMATGPGRFALGSASSLVQAFFAINTDLSWAVGHSYSKSEMATLLGVSSYGIDIKQIYVDDLSGDYWERSYVWNSGSFELNDSTDLRFVVDADGTRHIENYSIVPRSDVMARMLNMEGSC